MIPPIFVSYPSHKERESRENRLAEHLRAPPWGWSQGRPMRLWQESQRDRGRLSNTIGTPALYHCISHTVKHWSPLLRKYPIEEPRKSLVFYGLCEWVSGKTYTINVFNPANAISNPSLWNSLFTQNIDALLLIFSRHILLHLGYCSVIIEG